MPRVRPPAVAGYFYPADPVRLRADVDGYLAAARTALAARGVAVPGTQTGPELRPSAHGRTETRDSSPTSAPSKGSASESVWAPTSSSVAPPAARAEETAGPRPKALIVPHAGYRYSGSTAALGYAAIDPRGITRVVLLGPAHRVHVDGLARASADAFASPLGDVLLGVLGDDVPNVVRVDAPHVEEHSLEVQLPFLQRVLGDFELIPLVVGGAEPDQVADALEALWGGPETLIVISTDLSHYLPYAQARAVDAKTIEQILALDGPLTHRQACGATPLNGLLVAARRRGLVPTLLGACNSADTVGDAARVVGYAAFALGEAK